MGAVNRNKDRIEERKKVDNFITANRSIKNGKERASLIHLRIKENCIKKLKQLGNCDYLKYNNFMQG